MEGWSEGQGEGMNEGPCLTWAHNSYILSHSSHVDPFITHTWALSLYDSHFLLNFHLFIHLWAWSHTHHYSQLYTISCLG